MDWTCRARGYGLQLHVYIDLLEKFILESKPGRDRGKKNPLITQSYLSAIQNKHKKWSKYKYCKYHENFNQYKIARNHVTEELLNAKYFFEKNLPAKIKTDNKLFWNYVRQKSKTKSSVSKLLMSNGNLTSSDQETANTLNEYFAGVFTEENENNIPEFEHRNFNQILHEISITEKQV